jgi:hypothetical protein
MSSDENCVRIHDYSQVSDRSAESLKNVAKVSHEASSCSIELIHALIRTGMIEELARTIFETTNAIRDTANEISGIIKDLKETGTLKNTASIIVETTSPSKTTLEIAKNTSISANEASETTPKN